MRRSSRSWRQSPWCGTPALSPARSTCRSKKRWRALAWVAESLWIVATADDL